MDDLHGNLSKLVAELNRNGHENLRPVMRDLLSNAYPNCVWTIDRRGYLVGQIISDGVLYQTPDLIDDIRPRPRSEE